MGARWLPAVAQRVASGRRSGRRPLRPASGLRGGLGDFHRGVGGLWLIPIRGLVDRGPAAAGCGSGSPGARQPRPDRRRDPARRQGAGGGHLGRYVWCHLGPRPVHRWLARRRRVLAVGFLAECSPGRGGRVDNHPARARVTGRSRRRPRRPRRRCGSHDRPRGCDLPAHRGAVQRLDAGRRGGRSSRRRRAGGLCRDRAPGPGTASAIRPVPFTPVQRREPDHVRRLRRARRCAVPAGAAATAEPCIIRRCSLGSRRCRPRSSC